MASREENKTQRRGEIIAAARALMQEPGNAAFSMRALAEQAGVSIATPYNLFGSKQAVLVSLLDDNLADYQSHLSELTGTGADALFEAIGLMCRLFAAEPDFYRNLISAVVTDSGPELKLLIGGPRYALWKLLLQKATEAGDLNPDADPDAFAVTLTQLLAATVQEWALGSLGLKEMEARLRYALALTLCAIATERSARKLRTRLEAAEGDLQTLWRAALKRRLKEGPLDEHTRALLADQLKHLEEGATNRHRKETTA
ncbi:MAG: TetR/AcrR family transcriptional regulator [Pseudomonadales bacterium]